MAVIMINVIYQMVETTTVCLILKRHRTFGRKCQTLVIVCITIQENNGGIVVR